LPAEWAVGSAKDALEGRALDASALKVAPKSTLVALLTPAAARGFEQAAVAAFEQWRKGTQKRSIEVSAVGTPPLEEGEALYLAGSGPELGAWDPSRALGPLDAEGRLRALLPVGAAFELKLVIRRRDGTFRWEEGDNRSLFVEEAAGPLPLKLAWASR
jgi:hypothetical protein